MVLQRKAKKSELEFSVECGSWTENSMWFSSPNTYFKYMKTCLKKVHEDIHILRMYVFAHKPFAFALARKGTSLLVSHLSIYTIYITIKAGSAVCRDG